MIKILFSWFSVMDKLDLLSLFAKNYLRDFVSSFGNIQASLALRSFLTKLLA
jgi:hypothetical protein